MRTRAVLVVGLALGVGGIAEAKPVKAHVVCLGNDVAVTSGKAVRLGDTLWCSIAVDSLGDFKAAAIHGGLAVIPGPKSTLKQQPGGVEGPVHDTADGVEYTTEKPFAVDVDYKKCEPFAINASLDDFEHPGSDMMVWSTVFKVAASCPAPKQVAGKLACNATGQDGTIFRWPGNGAKVKPRLETTLSCTISAGKPEAGVTYAVSLQVAKRGTPVTGGFDHDEAGNGFFSGSFDQEVYEACSNFTVLGEVRGNGAALWSGKLAIKQDCPD